MNNVNIKFKKEKLIKATKNLSVQFEYVVYSLIEDPYLSSIIKKIDDNIIIKHNEFSCLNGYEQFILLINKFISFFYQNFPDMFIYFSYIFDSIIISNKKIFTKYLLSTYSLCDEQYKDYYENLLYEILISNFNTNAAKIECLKNLFVESNIILVIGAECYSKKELKEVFKLLTDIAFCNQNNFSKLYLFSNINRKNNNNIFLNPKENNVEETESTKNKYFFERYQELIANYLEKKYYIHYFKKDYNDYI